jgi:hypothetical protein
MRSRGRSRGEIRCEKISIQSSLGSDSILAAKDETYVSVTWLCIYYLSSLQCGIAVCCMVGSTERGIELWGILKRTETDSGLWIFIYLWDLMKVFLLVGLSYFESWIYFGWKLNSVEWQKVYSTSIGCWVFRPGTVPVLDRRSYLSSVSVTVVAEVQVFQPLQAF